MRKKSFSLFFRLLIITLTIFLSAALFLNISTMISMKKIQNGHFIQSGYSCAIVGSGSMRPEIFVNDLVIIQSVESYQKDEIATYVSEHGTLVTHRIKEISDSGYIMQGDANNTADGEVARQRIMGKVVFVVPGAGLVIRAFSSPVLLICFPLFSVGIILLVRTIRKIKEEGEAAEE